MDPLFEDESMDVLAQENGLTDSPFQNQHSHYIQSLFETCSIEGEAIVLPTQICENASVLTEMLSSELLSEVLTLEDVQHLHSYLPVFKTDLETERQKTWAMLFSKQNFMFGNPVEHFSRKMECGLYNPDIAQTRNLFQKLQKKNVKREQRNYYFNLLQSVVMSRQHLIEAASQLPPGKLYFEKQFHFRVIYFFSPFKAKLFVHYHYRAIINHWLVPKQIVSSQTNESANDTLTN